MQNITYLTVLRFSLQLFICEAAFLITRQIKKYFIPRLTLAIAIHFVLAYSLFFLLRLIPGSILLLNALFFLGVAVLSVVAAMLCFEVTATEMTFIATCGYATEHITFAVTRIVVYLFNISGDVLSVWLDFILTRFGNYVLVAVLIYLFLVRPNSLKEAFYKRDFRFFGLAIAAVVAAVVLSSWYTAPDVSENTMFYTHFLCPMYSSMCCLMIIVMEYYIFRENRATLEKESMEQLMQITESQRLTTKASIDIINMRCHDLKHHMKALISETDNEEKREYIESIRRATDIYDSTFHTGNEALDYILCEKKLLAQEIGIEFNCMADGTCLDFMQKVDIYALMGNAIDNALEHLEEEREGERFVFLTIRMRAGMVAIRLENTCTIEVQFKDGMPETTKPDKESHGFGVRSIRFVAEKYGGDVFMEVKDGRFILNVMLPAGDNVER